MASKARGEEEDPPVQVVASCDSTGVTVINEDAAGLEEGLVEVAYINISEAMMLDEIEAIETSAVDDDGTRQSWEFEALEIEDEGGESDGDVTNVCDDEEQMAVTNDYLTGKISFQDFITRVEGADGTQKHGDERSDEDDHEDPGGSQDDDPDYVPEEEELSKTSRKGKNLKHKPHIVESPIAHARGSPSSKGRKPSGSPKKVKKIRKPGSRHPKKLPANLLGLMGEANLRWARNEKEDAVNLCMEVIRQAPSYAEPFQTLSMFYEELEEYEKAYQLSLIAAYLSPQDADEWLRLHELCLSREDLVQASKCLAKAVQADPSNLEIHKRRCELLEAMGAQQELVEAYLTMLRGVQPEEEKKGEWVELAVRIARMRHADGHFHSARRALSNALVHCADHFTMEHYNLLLDLLILTKHYIDVVKVLNRYCGAVFDKRLIDEIDLQECTTMNLTQDLPIDIQSKLCISLVHCKKLDFAMPLVVSFLDCNVEEFGDIYLDVAEALLEKNYNEEALVLLEQLVGSQSYSLAAVWLKLANCLTALPGRMEDAVAAFRHVIQLAPSNPDARITLAEVLTKIGRYEEALEAVTQESDTACIEATVLHHRCLLLLKEERWDQFIQTFKLMMMRHSKNIRSKDEIHKACGAKKIGWDTAEEETDEEELEFGSSSIDVEEEYRLLRLAIEYLFNQNRLVELERLCFTALTSSLFRRKRDIQREIHFITLQVCIVKGDSYYAYNLVRSLLLRSNANMHNNRVWNLFIQVIMRGDDIRYNRFLMRLLVKHPDHMPLSILNGHACVASGTYKYALDEYLYACKLEPENPFYPLLAAIVFIQLTCQKFSSGKHSLVTQATAFFDAYLRIRGPCQEVYYNIGRGYHQLGLLPQALDFYKKALQCPPSVTTGKYAHCFDLSREIAFNLSLIYRTADPSGLDVDVARMYIDKYITV